jgi:dUTPase
MKISYATDKTGSFTVIDGIFILTANKGAEVQSGEIKKISTGVVLRAEVGYVLQLSTHPTSAEKAVQLFPASMTLTSNSPEEYLMLAIQNVGRNTFIVRPGDIIAQGFAIPIEKVEEELYVVEPAGKKTRRTKPQKNNSDIKFEVN